MTDHKELLKKLVDAPFGKAEEMLREKGFWDETRVPKSERNGKEYEVTLIGTQQVSAIVTVFAKDEAEAKRLARDEVDMVDWDDDGDVEFMNIDRVDEVEE